jgi:molybdopterin-biosynthesis enzyme MoeA-like protein
MVRTDAFGTADGCAPQAYIRESRRIDAEDSRDSAAGHRRGAAYPAGTQRAQGSTGTACGIGWYGIDIHAASGPGHAVGRF